MASEAEPDRDLRQPDHDVDDLKGRHHAEKGDLDHDPSDQTCSDQH
jgi:hypothetical protein